MIKVYLKDLMYTLLSILIGMFVFTILNYFNIISDNILNVIKLIFIIGNFIFSGFYLARRSKKRGIIVGLKIGSIISLFMLLITLLGLNSIFKWQNLIYYLILVISSMIGGILGKQTKKQY